MNLNAQLQVEMTNGRFQSNLVGSLATTLDTTYHYVITVQGNGATCSTAWYCNGAQVGAGGSTPFALSAIEDLNNRVGRSMWSSNFTASAS